MSNPNPEPEPRLDFPIDGNEAMQIEYDDDLVDDDTPEDEDEGHITDEVDDADTPPDANAT